MPETPTRRWRLPAVNPVLRRELVERWRGRRAFVVLTVYLGLLTGLVLLLLWAASSAMAAGFDTGPALGRFLAENVLALVLLLVLFVGPGYAAAQISQERERRTLGLLQITLVSPWRIVLGKLGAASAWLLLLVVSAAPMAATAFFLGGVAIGDLLRAVLYVVLLTVAVAAIGIGVSSLVRRTVAAVVLTYGIVLALVVGTLFGAGIEAAVQRDSRPALLQANPVVGLADAARVGPTSQLPSILQPAAFYLEPDPFAGEVIVDQPAPQGGMGEPLILQGGEVFGQPDRDRDPVWLRTLGLHLALGALGLVVAAQRVRPGRGPRRARREPGGTRTLEAPGPPPPPTPAPPPSGGDAP